MDVDSHDMNTVDSTDVNTLATPVVSNRQEEESTMVHNFLVSDGTPSNEAPVRAMIDGRAKAAVTNLLSHLHGMTCHSEKNPCEVKMCGAVDKDNVVTPVAWGCLCIPALTLQRWVDIKCHCTAPGSLPPS